MVIYSDRLPTLKEEFLVFEVDNDIWVIGICGSIFASRASKYDGLSGGGLCCLNVTMLKYS